MTAAHLTFAPGPPLAGAILSFDGRYRYRLWRIRNPSYPPLVFVMLNPSTADATQDDPTIGKCMGFAERLGYGGIVVVNLYAYRATDPKRLVDYGLEHAIGPENDAVIQKVAKHRPDVVCAWGAWTPPGAFSRDLHVDRTRRVMDLLEGCRTVALKLTRHGAPYHPLYVPYSAKTIDYPGPRS